MFLKELNNKNTWNRKLITLFLLRDPGGFKKSVKEIEEEKFTTYMWELFLTNTKVLLIYSLGTNPIFFQAFILFVA